MAEQPIRHCPIIEQTADGTPVGRCWYTLDNGVCPRHGDVSPEVSRYERDGLLTMENRMLRRKGLPTFPLMRGAEINIKPTC